MIVATKYIKVLPLHGHHSAVNTKCLLVERESSSMQNHTLIPFHVHKNIVILNLQIKFAQ
jgi:hypothetical protein